jgi:hypothetical protein
MLQEENSLKFIKYKRIFKSFKVLFDNKEMMKKMQAYYNKSIKSKRKKIYSKYFLNLLKGVFIRNQEDIYQLKSKLESFKKTRIKQYLFKCIKSNLEEKKDQNLKNSLIEKLKSAAFDLIESDTRLKFN